MAAKDRQQVLNSFNTPPDLEGGHHRVLLLSLKAGGVGLNLTVSNVVIALDLAWNAATGMSCSFANGRKADLCRGSSSRPMPSNWAG
jgi:hypothetical protein